MSKQKSKLVSLTYQLLNSCYGDAVDIKRDPLHLHYDVNKYCLIVHPNDIDIKTVYRRIIMIIRNKMDNVVTVEEEKSYGTVLRFKMGDKDISYFVKLGQTMPNIDPDIISIGIH